MVNSNKDVFILKTRQDTFAVVFSLKTMVEAQSSFNYWLAEKYSVKTIIKTNQGDFEQTTAQATLQNITPTKSRYFIVGKRYVAFCLYKMPGNIIVNRKPINIAQILKDG